MKLTRRRLLGGAAAAVAGGAGIYELVEQLGTSPQRPASSVAAFDEQHLIDLRTTQSEGVEVVVPPLHSEIVTATVRDVDLRKAQQQLDAALASLESSYDPTTPAGLGVTVAWGVPYFARVHAAAQRHLPFDRRARKPVLLPTRRFPSDPEATILEQNDVAFLLRSDTLAHI
jgi:hypothetical protein